MLYHLVIWDALQASQSYPWNRQNFKEMPRTFRRNGGGHPCPTQWLPMTWQLSQQNRHHISQTIVQVSRIISVGRSTIHDIAIPVY